MRTRRNSPLALAALLALALAAACGPGDPPSPPTTGDPTSGGGGSGSGGSGGPSGGGDGSGPSGGGTPGSGTEGAPAAGEGSAGGGGGGGGGGSAPSVPAAFAVVLGGAGDEWCQDVAAAPGGDVVALTVVGPREGGRFDQLGLTRISGGAAQPGRLYDLGAPVGFARDGALSVGPGGEVYLALVAQCGASACAGLGTRLNGAGLLQLSAGGDPRWAVQLPGALASQPVVDPPGNVAVATSEGGANVVRSFTAAGAQRWQVSLPGGASGDVSLAADSGANVLVGRGSEVTKITPAGAIAWTRAVGAQVEGVAGTASGAVVVAGTTSSGPAILQLGADGSDGPVRPLPGPGGDTRVEVGGGRRIGAVTGAGGCGATVTALDVDGGALWSRPVAAAGCDASQLRVNGVTVTTNGVVVIGGALAGTVDLGGAQPSSQATDALVAGFGS